MKQAWRWFGPSDPVTLDDIRQAGATDIVTALHDTPIGEAWPLEQVQQRKALIEDSNPQAPLTWSVIESIPVHDDIKRGADGWRQYAHNFAESLVNVKRAGIDTVCYNFMPVIDWTRTDLNFELPNGARALRFDACEFAAFDIHVLKRARARDEWGADMAEKATRRFANMSEQDLSVLQQNVIAGLPGRMTESYDLASFKSALDAFSHIDREQLFANLIAFLSVVIPVAEDVGVQLAIHPDDPPRPLLGLPRVVCNSADLDAIFAAVPSTANGLTLCAGTFGVLPENDLPAMAQRFGDRIAFAHLRGTRRDEDNVLSFTEAEHLDSDVDMLGIINALLAEEHRRGPDQSQIVFRPDHGHQMMGDLHTTSNPGYSGIGRMRGLAELRGAICALQLSIH